MKKHLIKFLMVAIFAMPFLVLNVSPVSAATTDPDSAFGLGYVDGSEGTTDGIVLGDRDPREMVAGIINFILALLGIIAVVIVLLGGFKWMTSAGSEDKIAEAKKLLGAGVVGLIIVLSAWGITTLVLNELFEQTGVGT